MASFLQHFGVVLVSFFYTFGQFFLDLFWHRFELIFGLFGAGLTLLGGFSAFLCQELVIWEGLGQKMELNLKPSFEEDTGRYRSEGTRSNGHELLEIAPVLGAKEAIIRANRKLVLLCISFKSTLYKKSICL